MRRKPCEHQHEACDPCLSERLRLSACARTRRCRQRLVALNPEEAKRRERAAYPARKGRVLFRYGILRATAKRRGIACVLTKGEYSRAIAPGHCHYCLGALPLAGSGLDRIDNRLGYSAENVVPCCTACNAARWDRLSHEEMIVLGRAIQGILRARAAAAVAS